MLRGIVSGMQFMHSVMGVVHGDLKPLNLLLQRGQIKLCDFGSSRLLRHPNPNPNPNPNPQP